MSRSQRRIPRRRFLKTAASASAAFMAPTIIPGSALGRDGAVPPSERIAGGALGSADGEPTISAAFLEQTDVQFAAVCDVKEARRTAIKKMADEIWQCKTAPCIATFASCLDRKAYRCGVDCHGTQLARDGRHDGRQGRQRHVLRKALYKNISQSLILAERCAAPAGSFKPARNDAICRTSPLPANWPAPASSAS